MKGGRMRCRALSFLVCFQNITLRKGQAITQLACCYAERGMAQNPSAPAISSIRKRFEQENGSFLPFSLLFIVLMFIRYFSFHQIIRKTNNFGSDFFPFFLYDTVVNGICQAHKKNTDYPYGNTDKHSHPP